MLDFTTRLDRWYELMHAVPPTKLAAILCLGARIVDLLLLGKAK